MWAPGFLLYALFVLLLAAPPLGSMALYRSGGTWALVAVNALVMTVAFPVSVNGLRHMAASDHRGRVACVFVAIYGACAFINATLGVLLYKRMEMQKIIFRSRNNERDAFVPSDRVGIAAARGVCPLLVGCVYTAHYIIAPLLRVWVSVRFNAVLSLISML